MRRTQSGEFVRFLTDKRSAVRDLEAYAHVTGHGLQGAEPMGDLWRVTISAR